MVLCRPGRDRGRYGIEYKLGEGEIGGSPHESVYSTTTLRISRAFGISVVLIATVLSACSAGGGDLSIYTLEEAERG